MKTKSLIGGAVIAGLYLMLTIIFSPICFKAFHVRISEGLTLLPFLTIILPIIINAFVVSFYKTLLTGGNLTLKKINFKLYFSISSLILIGRVISIYLIGFPLIIYLSKLKYFKEA